MKAAAMKETNLQRRSADVDIAVLQVQYSNIEEKVSDLKAGLKDIRESIQHAVEKTSGEIKAMSDRSELAHNELGVKISRLEKWKWMMMGAGIAIGTVGWNVFTEWDKISILLK
jgi:predicted  nucleic acid-binding Zn-ribbon protein